MKKKKMYAAPNKIPTCAHRYRGRVWASRVVKLLRAPGRCLSSRVRSRSRWSLDIPQRLHGELPEEEGSISLWNGCDRTRRHSYLQLDSLVAVFHPSIGAPAGTYPQVPWNFTTIRKPRDQNIAAKSASWRATTLGK